MTSEGVWAVIDSDYVEAIQMVFPIEIEALRILNGRGYGRVAFIPWGMSLTEAEGSLR